MILIGQYDSPFVRRVGIALRLYDLVFEHKPWSTFADGERVAAYNPLRRVPALVLEGGEVLIESIVILDYLDELIGPARALVADAGPARRQALKICALATGTAEKAVSLFYEHVLHETASQTWVERCRSQIGGALDVLEFDRARRTTPCWFGDSLGHADLAVACALRFINEAHPGLFDPGRWPALAAHATQCEAMSVFQDIAQPFIPPA